MGDSSNVPTERMKIVVVEGPPAKNIPSLNYLGYHTGRVGMPGNFGEDGSLVSALAEEEELSLSSSCESSWLIGCCIIHPL